MNFLNISISCSLPKIYVPPIDMVRGLLGENARLREQLMQCDEQIRVLNRRVEELDGALAKVRKTSSTSSKPPSSDIVKPP